MGQAEVLEVVARLNDRLNRPVTKKEIAAEAGYTLPNTTQSLIKLKRWGEIELAGCIIKKGVEFRYIVPGHVRQKIES
jgi:hypothetical protein